MEFDKYPTNLVKMQLRDVDEYLFDINQIELASTGFSVLWVLICL